MTTSDILSQFAPRMENVLLILHAVQNRHRRHYLSEKDMALVADYLNTSLAVIYGIASYYTMFSLSPRGKHLIRICDSPVCHMTGGCDVAAELKKVLGIGNDETTADRLFTMETSQCLGHCEAAPAMTIDDVVYPHLTTAKINTIIDDYRQNGRRVRRTKR